MKPRNIAALCASLSFCFTVSQAHAACTKVDATSHTVTCNSFVLASAGFTPALTTAGGGGNPVIKVKGTLYGCTDNTDANLVIDKGAVSGILNGTAGNGCTTLLGSTTVTGSLVVKWKAAATSTDCYLSNVTTLTPHTINGTTFGPSGAITGSYGAFQVPGATLPSVTGAYSGNDAGASTTFFATTTEDFGALLGFCNSVKGLKTAHLGLATLKLQ
jgi:hypothetical protein